MDVLPAIQGELLPAPFQDGHLASYISDLHSISYPEIGRAGGIRTTNRLYHSAAYLERLVRDIHAFSTADIIAHATNGLPPL
jgi:hypothetical protein